MFCRRTKHLTPVAKSRTIFSPLTLHSLLHAFICSEGPRIAGPSFLCVAFFVSVVIIIKITTETKEKMKIYHRNVNLR